jgi:hypothetical protein
MNRSVLVLAGMLGAGLAASSPALVAGQQNQPGFPTLAKVHVLNRERTEAVPVKVQGGGDVLPVSVVGEPTVVLLPTAVVSTRTARQLWEYRRIVVAAKEDPTAALNSAGGEGWEAVGSATLGETIVWMLKRPR